MFSKKGRPSKKNFRSLIVYYNGKHEVFDCSSIPKLKLNIKLIKIDKIHGTNKNENDEKHEIVNETKGVIDGTNKINDKKNEIVDDTKKIANDTDESLKRNLDLSFINNFDIDQNDLFSDQDDLFFDQDNLFQESYPYL